MEIKDLCKLYCEMISGEHHKDSDMIFHINETYAYGQDQSYVVEHYGYINELEATEFKTHAEAEKFLKDKLESFINSEYKSAKNKISNEKEWDSIDIEIALRVIEIYEKAINLIAKNSAEEKRL